MQRASSFRYGVVTKDVGRVPKKVHSSMAGELY